MVKELPEDFYFLQLIDLIYLFYFTAVGRYNSVSKGRNGTGHLELGMCNSQCVVNVDANLMQLYFSSQLCHVAIWGSIASWFIFLLIYCIPGIALYIAPDMIGQVWLFSYHVLTFKSVDETLPCDHSYESY